MTLQSLSQAWQFAWQESSNTGSEIPWRSISYYPLVSNVTGVLDILSGAAAIVVSVVGAIFTALVAAYFLYRGTFEEERSGINLIFGYALTSLVLGVSLIARGIIEQIPLAGNAGLYFWDNGQHFRTC